MISQMRIFLFNHYCKFAHFLKFVIASIFNSDILRVTIFRPLTVSFWNKWCIGKHYILPWFCYLYYWAERSCRDKNDLIFDWTNDLQQNNHLWIETVGINDSIQVHCEVWTAPRATNACNSRDNFSILKWL